MATGLRITAIHNRRTGARDLNDEYVVIRNESTQVQSLAGYVVTSRTTGRRDDCNFVLPNRIYTEGRTLVGWTCDPGALLFIRSGAGRDQLFPRAANQPAQLHFYMGRGEFTWDIAGDEVYLRHPHGQFVTVPFTVP